MKNVFSFLAFVLVALTLLSSCKKEEETIQIQYHEKLPVIVHRSLPLADQLYLAGFDSQEEGAGNFSVITTGTTDTVWVQLDSFIGSDITFDAATEEANRHGVEMLKEDVLAGYIAQYGVTEAHPIAAIGSFNGEGKNKVSPGAMFEKGKKKLVLMNWKNGPLHKNHYGYGPYQYFLASPHR